ncbi:MAG: hypothetical protein PHD51_04635 [Patescibacteria group bacterium]|nr:hypothetical protein [Patescibacteria group bacterium]MDD5490787.1 hypothetical protein [Patescibacteria group bacterium]
MNLSNLLNYEIWFNTHPGPLLKSSLIALVVIFLVFMAGSVIIKKFSDFRWAGRIKKIIWRKISNMLGWLGILGLVYLFFAYEGVPVLGMRLWFLLWLIGLIVWLIFIIRYAVVKIPLKEKEQAEREHFEKYLPKKKK